jgi:catechol 2,3-dioxygenase-like lactoylglutathione lyase family enzyme
VTRSDSLLDHVSLRVANYDLSRQFYQEALAPLGYVLAMETESGAQLLDQAG